jgi:hypothetical protein
MQLKRYAKLYAETEDGKWLNDFDWQKVKLVTVSDFHDIATMGMYSFGKILVRDTNIELVFSTYIHELYHQWQRKQSFIHYVAGKFLRIFAVILGRFGIKYDPRFEREADAETLRADRFIATVQLKGI